MLGLVNDVNVQLGLATELIRAGRCRTTLAMKSPYWSFLSSAIFAILAASNSQSLAATSLSQCRLPTTTLTRFQKWQRRGDDGVVRCLILN
jgi:hypothetical protein